MSLRNNRPAWSSLLNNENNDDSIAKINITLDEYNKAHLWHSKKHLDAIVDASEEYIQLMPKSERSDSILY